MDKLLLLTHRIPYPPDKGDKIRSYHLLRYLSTRYEVYLGTFVDDERDWQHLTLLRGLCAEVKALPLSPLKARVRSLRALAAGRALSVDYYSDRALAGWVARTVDAQQIGLMVCYSSPMAQYVSGYAQARRVMDFVDVDSDKWRQYAAGRRGAARWLYAREARLLLAYERDVARDFDASLFVSSPEAQLFRDLAPESAARIGHYSNGVDTAKFSPSHRYPSPFAADARALVFTGAMDYWPNVDAVTWFAQEVLPAVRQAAGDVLFYIVGARPSAAVQKLAELPGVHVTGTVPDVRPYVAHATLCVAPMRIARGIQNKVLEAMAMARPVLVSPQALEGIDAVPGRELLLAGDAVTTISAILDALRAPIRPSAPPPVTWCCAATAGTSTCRPFPHCWRAEAPPRRRP
ncbi:TIGR03087 family PEP-CTERM/XrtA system glycosyltransferase [Duganella sp. P38]|uniref:TIGR03087 family PEP-CTERM/XrtA system glycosyltransferase n=1 Tax=Duganella sp. P38 TaxID=3423949 RepID=UPI003D7B90E0